MWLRDEIIRDLPQARVMIYGYDTSLIRSSSFQNILDLGGAFRGALRTVRPHGLSPHVPRPLVLLGHSLGGIVVKEVCCSILSVYFNATAIRPPDNAIRQSSIWHIAAILKIN